MWGRGCGTLVLRCLLLALQRIERGNPLFEDAQFDYDGDSLTLAEEQALWKYTYEVNHSATRTLEPLSYTDGMQHSVHRFESGRNVPAAHRSVWSFQWGEAGFPDCPVGRIPTLASRSERS